MAKKVVEETETPEEPKVSKLDEVFSKFLPTHHVSFAQLKEILVAIVGDSSE